MVNRPLRRPYFCFLGWVCRGVGRLTSHEACHLSAKKNMQYATKRLNFCWHFNWPHTTPKTSKRTVWDLAYSGKIIVHKSSRVRNFVRE